MIYPVPFPLRKGWILTSSVELLWSFAALWAVVTLMNASQAIGAELRLSEYQKQNWQVEDGLPENNVRIIAQQSDGRLLLATSSGLSTFDGLRFHGLAIPGLAEGEAVNTFLEEKDGTLWLGTDGSGVFRYNRPGTAVNISEEAGLSNERIRSFHRDTSGVLWIATQNGIERYSNGHIEVLSQAGMISGDIASPFADDGLGGLFFVTSNGLFHWNGNAWKPYRLQSRGVGTPVAVYRDAQQRLWVGTTRSIVKLSLRADSQFDETICARSSSPVTVMATDAKGNLWFGTQQGGLYRISKNDVASWTSHDGLADDSICSIFIDSSQDLWIGTQTGGLSRWRIGAIAPLADDRGTAISSAANVFADSHGDVWLGTWGKGLYRMHDGRLANVTPRGMPASAAIRTIAENHSGQIWIGTWFDGIYRFEGASYRHYFLGTESPGNAVSALLVDKSGGLWVGTYLGLLYYPKGEPGAKYSLFLHSQLITCLLEDDDGSILAGTSKGLFRIRGLKEIQIPGLTNPHVLLVSRDSQHYTWIATQAGGLSLLRKDHVDSVNLKGPLANLPLATIVEDDDGDLWLGSIRGIVRVKVSALHAVADGADSSVTPVFLGREDGMRSSECVGTSLPASAHAKDGALWFVTAKGFVRTTDAAEDLGHNGPMMLNLGWTLTDDMDPAHAHNEDHIVAAPSQPDVTFLFNVVDLAHPSQIEFRYRLIGYDTDWTTTHMRSARYRHLPPGSYRFEIQARMSGEAWGRAISSLQLQQQSHFYQTWYAYLAIAGLIALMILQAFRQRIQLVRGQIGVIIEERNRIARECHDTLMAGLAATSWQLEVTSKIFRNNPAIHENAANSCEVARGMLSHCQAEARRIIWDLRDSDEITSLLSRALSRTIGAHDATDSIPITLDVEGEEVPFAPGDVHHLVCIAQEAISNALKHAGPSKIDLVLRYEAASLSLVVRDDGCGFRGENANVGHFGIPVMEERARKVGGVLRVDSSHGKGTEVSITVTFQPSPVVSQRPTYVIPWIGI